MINLDEIGKDLVKWLQTLYVEENGRGGYRMSNLKKANLLSTTDAAWLLYAMNNLEVVTEHHRKVWVQWLLDEQNKADGHYAYTDDVGKGNMHSNGHAFWHSNRALGILGSEISVFPELLRPAMSVEGLKNWFIEWGKKPNETHHDVLGLVPLLANTKNQEWIDCYFEEISKQQNPQTGTWPKNTTNVNISRTFAYSVLFRAVGRMPPQPEKIIDAMLSLQSDSGLWRDSNHSYFSSMDAVYILVRLPKLVNHKTDESVLALRKALEGFQKVYATEISFLKENTHAMLSVVHALGLLCEAFPGEFLYSKPWRFDWDKPALFQCGLLRNAIP